LNRQIFLDVGLDAPSWLGRASAMISPHSLMHSAQIDAFSLLKTPSGLPRNEQSRAVGFGEADCVHESSAAPRQAWQMKTARRRADVDEGPRRRGDSGTMAVLDRTTRR
jgi:hypothetical protein